MGRKSSFIFDTGALVQFFAGNEQVKEIMYKVKSGESEGYIPQIIFSEFYYKTWQKYGQQAAIVRTKTLRESALIEHILTEDNTYQVGEYLVKYRFLSLADAIVATTAEETKSTVISTDEDFSEVGKINSKKIDF